MVEARGRDRTGILRILLRWVKVRTIQFCNGLVYGPGRRLWSVKNGSSESIGTKYGDYGLGLGIRLRFHDIVRT